MRNLLLILMLFCFGAALAQNYHPKAGETVIKLQVEGRGNVFIKLFTKEAPKTTSHILALVKQGFYNGQRFHKVEKQPKPYLVWFGDPNTKDKDLDDPSVGTGGSGEKVPFESNSLTHEEMAVGLARSPDDKNSGDSQFYIVLAPAKFLDGNYVVFGRVVAGMDVVRKLERGDRVPTVTVAE